ncbi:cytochrome P450 [Xylariaceae sp. FL0255]|nr:cytochrome P450 [Xylariaceae sp. FL0255]
MMLSWVLASISSAFERYPLENITLLILAIIWFGLTAISTQRSSNSKNSFPLSLPLSWVKTRVNAWLFLIRGPEIIQDAYDRSNGKPFFVDAPDNRYLIVSSFSQIKEIDAAPDGVLSLLAAAKEVLQPRHTMVDFMWPDKKGTEGAPLLKTLRTLLTGHLPTFLPEMRCSMSTLFDELYESRPTTINGGKISPAYPMVIRAIAQSNAYALFGQELCGDKKFMKAAMVFVEETLIIAEVIRLLPRVISERIGEFLAKKLNSGRVVYDALEPVVSKRFAEREQQRLGFDVPEHKDCIQWIMETSPKTKPWSVKRVIHELIAVWFGSVHITSTTACFALYDLCLHPEYVEPLRQEIERTTWEAFDETGGKLFPLMDSFMKESARATPVEAVSTRRKATKPFQLSDGTRVEQGQWVCTAARGLNLDPANYAQANEFRGFRFVEPRVLEQFFSESSRALESDSFQIPEPGKVSQFIELSDTQLWGTGKSACTGRWYASAAIKTMLGLFITKWDLKLVDPKASRHFSWRTFIYPYASTEIVLTPRTVNVA